MPYKSMKINVCLCPQTRYSWILTAAIYKANTLHSSHLHIHMYTTYEFIGKFISNFSILINLSHWLMKMNSQHFFYAKQISKLLKRLLLVCLRKVVAVVVIFIFGHFKITHLSWFHAEISVLAALKCFMTTWK